jgi:hypothetical protein
VILAAVFLLACSGGGGNASGAGTFTKAVKQAHLGVHSVRVPADSVLLVTVTPPASNRVKVFAFEDVAALRGLASFFSTDASNFVPSESSDSSAAGALGSFDSGEIGRIKGVVVGTADDECGAGSVPPARLGVPSPSATTVQLVVELFDTASAPVAGTYTIELKIAPLTATHDLTTYSSALRSASFGNDFFGPGASCPTAGSSS